MRNVLLLCSLLFVAGCATTEYVGETYAPTSHVDLFFREADITRPHRIMGLVKTQAPDFLEFEAIKQQLVNDAMEKGADAILIEGMEEVVTSSSTRTDEVSQEKPTRVKTGDGKANAAGKTSSSSSISTTTETKDRVIAGKLIKYQ